LAEEHDAKAVDSYANAASRGHAVLKGHQEVFVQFLLFATGLLFKSFALLDRIILFSVRWGDFLTVDATFKNFHAIGFLR
jgi:hypothetical protein|tara:strand:- start:103 stop:342 length:240 start_codon:yes stop_codon:yes gene_type:complete